jgi:hypothetical protein
LAECFVAFQTGGFIRGTPTRSRDAGDYLLSVSAFGPKHLILFSPTGDPSKPGTGTTHLFYGTLAHTRNYVRSPGPVLDATKPSFHLISVISLGALGKAQRILVSPGEAESGSAGVQPDEE